MKNGAQKVCLGCDRRLIEVSNERGVRYWQKKLEGGNGPKLGGFTEIDGNLIRIVQQSPIIAEVWSQAFPLKKRYRRTLCPKCRPKYLQKKRIR